MEIEKSPDPRPSKRLGAKSGHPQASSDHKSNGKHQHSSKKSSDKTSSNDPTDSINRIEEMIHHIQTLPSNIHSK